MERNRNVTVSSVAARLIQQVVWEVRIEIMPSERHDQTRKINGIKVREFSGTTISVRSYSIECAL